MEILDSERVRAYFPPRRRDAHKGDFGKILLLCGSEGYTGAAALAAMGALRTGAGLVYLGTPRCVYPILAGKLLEPVVFPLPDDGKGYGSDTVAEVRERMKNMDAILIGCGMGQGSGAWEVLKAVLSEFEKPVILDADGINPFPAYRFPAGKDRRYHSDAPRRGVCPAHGLFSKGPGPGGAGIRQRIRLHSGAERCRVRHYGRKPGL